FIFNNIDNNYPGAVFSAVDAPFTEIFWFFPTVGSNGVANAYVKFNYRDNLWDYGPIASLSRSAWAGESQGGYPIAADYTGLLQAQDVTNDLDGVAMDSYAQT